MEVPGGEDGAPQPVRAGNCHSTTKFAPSRSGGGGGRGGDTGAGVGREVRPEVDGEGPERREIAFVVLILISFRPALAPLRFDGAPGSVKGR